MLLEVEGLNKSFGGVRAVDGASFAVAEGSLTALIGPNGAGKSTVFNIVSGFIRPDRGAIRFGGKPIGGRRGDVIARQGLVRAFQTPRVLTRMTVLENVMLAARRQPGERLVLPFVAPRRVARREADVRTRALELIEFLRLGPLTHAFAGTLSGGQRKLLELGRALIAEPRMILLDEPMAGVAPALAAELLGHIRALHRQSGVTIFVIEHDMDVVMSTSERVIVMDEGRVIADGSPADVQANERVIEAYLGRATPQEARSGAAATGTKNP